MTKTCNICKQQKLTNPDDPKQSEFAKDKKTPDGWQRKCKQCQKELSAKHYQANKAEFRARNTARRQIIRGEVRKLKETNPCTDCNSFYPFWVMQYDHTADDKVASVSFLIETYMNLQRVLDEIDKCELVCANCHATRTYRRAFPDN